MTILNPCPFCGGIPAVVEDGYKAIAVHCFNCGADITAESEKKARAAWNRRAQSNEPLTLEQLREAKDGAPLWMAYEDGAYGEWGLVCYNRDSFTVVGLHEHHKPDDYGKTWLAYRRKPERSEQE